MGRIFEKNCIKSLKLRLKVERLQEHVKSTIKLKLVLGI